MGKLTIRHERFDFFVANFADLILDDPLTCLNLDLLEKHEFSFGILVNDDPHDYEICRNYFKDSSIPIFHLSRFGEYYYIDIQHRPYLRGLKQERVTRIIVFDIRNIFSAIGLEPEFLSWLTTLLEKTYSYSDLFFVSYYTPFYMQRLFPHNSYIKELMKILRKYAHKNLVYFSTDSDFFNNIITFEPRYSDNFKQCNSCEISNVDEISSGLESICEDVSTEEDEFNDSDLSIAEEISNLLPTDIMDEIGIESSDKLLDDTLLNIPDLNATINVQNGDNIPNIYVSPDEFHIIPPKISPRENPFEIKTQFLSPMISINYFLIGRMSLPRRPPVIFDKLIGDDLFSGYYRSNQDSSQKSTGGFLNCIMENGVLKHSFVFVRPQSIPTQAINKMIQLVSNIEEIRREITRLSLNLRQISNVTNLENYQASQKDTINNMREFIKEENKLLYTLRNFRCYTATNNCYKYYNFADPSKKLSKTMFQRQLISTLIQKTYLMTMIDF